MNNFDNSLPHRSKRVPYGPVLNLIDAQMALYDIQALALIGEIGQSESERLETIARLSREIIASLGMSGITDLQLLERELTTA
jgi:hypothetical protein